MLKRQLRFSESEISIAFSKNEYDAFDSQTGIGVAEYHNVCSYLE